MAIVDREPRRNINADRFDRRTLFRKTAVATGGVLGAGILWAAGDSLSRISGNGIVAEASSLAEVVSNNERIELGKFSEGVGPRNKMIWLGPKANDQVAIMHQMPGGKDVLGSNLESGKFMMLPTRVTTGDIRNAPHNYYHYIPERDGDPKPAREVKTGLYKPAGGLGMLYEKLWSETDAWKTRLPGFNTKEALPFNYDDKNRLPHTPYLIRGNYEIGGGVLNPAYAILGSDRSQLYMLYVDSSQYRGGSTDEKDLMAQSGSFVRIKPDSYTYDPGKPIPDFRK